MQSEVDTSEVNPRVEDTFTLLQRRSRARACLFLPVRAEPADLFRVPEQQQVQPFSSLTPTRIHLTESREAIAVEVYAPTGSDSSSLAPGQDTVTNDAGPKAMVMVTNVDLSKEVVDVASVALERYNIEDIAAQIKEFDKRHEKT
ncbi:hypothetical protein C8Q76DRAFT_801786 [Earliella scabrosa]|nr:hypothetical protein C8Q76DRAFT_801786 [Earliella scabrosa]